MGLFVTVFDVTRDGEEWGLGGRRTDRGRQAGRYRQVGKQIQTDTGRQADAGRQADRYRQVGRQVGR